MKAVDLFEKEFNRNKARLYPNSLQAMPIKLQIDMTREFLKKQEKQMKDNFDERVKCLGIYPSNYKLHLENFLQALLMNLDQRENELIKEGCQEQGRIKELNFDYYRCALLIKILEDDS